MDKGRKPSEEVEERVRKFFEYHDRSLYDVEQVRWLKLMELLDERMG